MEVRKSTLKLALGAGCALAVLAAASTAAAEQRTFSLASSRATDTIPEFARQAGIQIVAPADRLRGVNTRAIEGRYDTREALAMLVEGTGLRIASDDGRTVTLVASDPQGGSAAGGGAEVEALIVTAQKREEDIQDVPIAISAFSQEDLTRSQVAGGPDLMTQVPNMTFTKTNFTSYSIQLRGIGTQAISATTDPAVAVAFNNTPFVRNHFFEQEFYDLERIEVLRGPQGTLYGRNATAGVVNVISAKPKFHFEAKASADVANYNSTRLEGMINIPLVEDKAALRIAGAWTKRDGFVKNILTGDQTDGRNLWSGRVSLAIEPNDRFRADLIYERFEEDDDRLRSGKQLCHTDPGYPGLEPSSGSALGSIFSQGCLPASLYSPDSFQTPNGYALPYYGAAGQIGSPVYLDLNPYASEFQSRNLREIETHIEPEYEAQADLVELQLRFDLTDALTLASETGWARDYIFSWQDFNRFDTTPGVFVPGGITPTDPRFDVVSEGGVFCDPQVGCSTRLAAADIATAESQQFSQEFRLSSDYDGPFNFNFGVNFLRYDTEDKYYVFINSLTAFPALYSRGDVPGEGTVGGWVPGETDNDICYERRRNQIDADVRGYAWSDPNRTYGIGCVYIDPNGIHDLNDQGRNYFLSKNPYHLLSYAAFGEAYYNLTPNLKLTAGFRWTVDKKTAPQHPSWLYAEGTYGTPARKVIEQEWREPTGRLAIDWKPTLDFTDETLVFASYVRGYKAGGANPPPPIVVIPPIGEEGFLSIDYLNVSLTHPEAFNAEYVDAFEVGTKNTLLDGRMTLNLGAFYYDYQGYQISQIVNRSAVNLNFDAEIWGAELEADWRPVENLRFGLKIGYENTRMADGSQAIDLMDRTAGEPGWAVLKPTPPQASNCVIDLSLLDWTTGLGCGAFVAGIDPITFLPYVPNPTEYSDNNGNIYPITPTTVTYGVNIYGYPGYDPSQANNGQGFLKDLSGNELPNAPDYTATLTADYTLPLANEWLMTLHTDLYYQSEAWTRVFNTEGYDKLKAYTNVNFAAIFTNEAQGWNVMAYVKNVLDRDSITGAFLNSDDTGLTTNVFLTEPRLYGLRVTKNWSGGAPWGGWFAGDPNGHHPFRLELGGYYGEFSENHEPLTTPTTDLFTPDFPYPVAAQEDLDWGSAGGVKLTWQPSPGSWSLSSAIRYGRASGDAEAHPKQAVAGGYILEAFRGDPKYYFDPSADFGIYSYVTKTAANEESHAVVDFMVGKDVGLGLLGAGSSTIQAGLRYARLKSTSEVNLHARPDVYFPETDIAKYGGRFHRVHADVDSGREFEGAGLAAGWEGAWPLMGNPGESGQLNLELGLGGSVLWGKQEVEVEGEVRGDYTGGIASLTFLGGPGRYYISSPYVTPISERRSRRVTVPTADVSLGLSYEIGRTKISGGYRFERFFDAIDGGFAERQEFDRDINGAYFKVAVGFGG